jgi:hypothetical protein
MLFFPTEITFSLSSSIYNNIIILSILNIQKKCSKHKTHWTYETKLKFKTCTGGKLSGVWLWGGTCVPPDSPGVWWWPTTAARRRAKPCCPQRCMPRPGPMPTRGFYISLGGSLPKLTSFEAKDCGASSVISSPTGTWGSYCDINNNYSNQYLLLRQE